MTPYGCHSKPREIGYWANEDVEVNLYSLTMIQHAIYVLDTMSKQCQYRKGQPTDPKCEGCTCE